MSMDKALAGGLLGDAMQIYAEGEIISQPLGRATTLKPWTGYWVEAGEACELVFHSQPLTGRGAQENEKDVVRQAIEPRKPVTMTTAR
jgi:hypothetical protein